MKINRNSKNQEDDDDVDPEADAAYPLAANVAMERNVRCVLAYMYVTSIFLIYLSITFQVDALRQVASCSMGKWQTAASSYRPELDSL